MDEYPGFTPEQIKYLTQRFPLPVPTPGDTLEDLMYRSGMNAVVRHIIAQESNNTTKGEPMNV